MPAQCEFCKAVHSRNDSGTTCRECGGRGMITELPEHPTPSFDDSDFNQYRGVNYYRNYGMAREVLLAIKDVAPESRIVEYGRGFAVQYYRSGPYYPELERPSILPKEEIDAYIERLNKDWQADIIAIDPAEYRGNDYGED